MKKALDICMLVPTSNAINVVYATLDKVTKLARPVRKFIVHIIELWLSMNCRYVFTNLQRWGERSEKSYRSMFCKAFDWFEFNYTLLQQHCSKEFIAVFDPSYIVKSGKHTYGVDKFWSGTKGRAVKGLEIGCLAFVDILNATAMHVVAQQTPCLQELKAEGKTLIHHYASIIEKYMDKIKALTSYLVVDGFFMKQAFIKPLLKRGLHIITKARKDVNLRYLYKGKQKWTGRPRLYAGKVNLNALNKNKIRCQYKDKDKTVYTAILYCVQLKLNVLVAFVYYKKKVQPEILISTDTQIPVSTLCRYYKLRFQIEFLIRDAKQHTGLEHCQGRSKPKLHNHFNVTLSVITVAKAAYFLCVPKEKRGAFSMADIKMMHMNQLLTNRVFQNLELNPNDEKLMPLYQQCINFARLRA